MDKRQRTVKISAYLIACIIVLASQGNLAAQTIVERGTSKLFRLDPSGKLVYSTDRKGNRLPDFSHVGYHSGEKAIPQVSVRITLEPSQGDDTHRIQDALDKLGKLPADKDGIRGALLLKRGVYRVKGRLIMSHNGTVLRGEGNGLDGSTIIATGYDDFKYQRSLITIEPRSNISGVHTSHGHVQSIPVKLLTDSKQEIVDEYVPVGSHSFSVKSAVQYEPGDRIVVYRPSTTEWIHAIGCDQLTSKWNKVANIRWVKDGRNPGFHYERPGSFSTYFIHKKEGEIWIDFVKRIPLSEDGKTFDFTRQWEAGSYDFYFERKLTAVKGNRITIDAPIVQSMEQRYGGGAIYHYETPERVSEVGIENLRLISEFATPTPGNPYGDPGQKVQAEKHAWDGVQITNNTENTWVRNVTGNYFAKALVAVRGKSATVQDCVNLGHASRITGGRRYPFIIQGQLNLVQRCVTFDGRHEFVTQARTAGPNVFVDCVGFNSKSSAGPHHRYSVGTLFDNVRSERGMESRFRGNLGTGHGWAGTQTCFYNCIAPRFDVNAPPGGICWVIGSGKRDEEGARVRPASLYYQQVQDRLGKVALSRLATDKQRKYLGQYRWAKARLQNEKKSE
jgi:hypothetical protein